LGLNERIVFQTETGLRIPAVTAEQMREVDRIAMQEFGLGVLQMMENVRDSLAGQVMDMLGGLEGSVVILAHPAATTGEKAF
jgi:NAD(P)H-hydrate epimerase